MKNDVNENCAVFLLLQMLVINRLMCYNEKNDGEGVFFVNDNQPFVFVSYSHKDSHLVLPCIKAMEKSGINLWYDDGIESGAAFPETLARKVRGCAKFLLFYSASYDASPWCQGESTMAVDLKKDILTVFLGNEVLSGGMRIKVGSYQAIRMRDYYSQSDFQKDLCSKRFFDSCRLSGQTVVTGETGIRKRKSTDNPFLSRATKEKSRMIAALLAVFLGFFGVHKFYLGQVLPGMLYLALFFIGLNISPYIGFVGVVLSVLEAILLVILPSGALRRLHGCEFRWI